MNEREMKQVKRLQEAGFFKNSTETLPSIEDVINEILYILEERGDGLRIVISGDEFSIEYFGTNDCLCCFESNLRTSAIEALLYLNGEQ